MACLASCHSQNALAKAGKGFIKTDRAKALIQRLHDNNVIVDSCLLFGFDQHDHSIFNETIAFVDDVQLDVMHPNYITPFPGTRFYKQLDKEGRLLTRDWNDYDCSHVVFQPKNMTPQELEDGVYYVHKALNSMGRRFGRMRRVSGMRGMTMAVSIT